MILRDLSSFDTAVQNEALINEFKGNLFEFLVGSFISRKFKFEASYLQSLNPKLKEQFSYYERWLRKHDRDLITKLPQLANQTANELVEYVQDEIVDAIVIGKIASASGNDSFHEADLVLKTNSENYPISIKLCKANSFVNTKSAGVGSFISKYFSSFNISEKLQMELQRFVQIEFERMCFKMHEVAGLASSNSFQGEWKAASMPELPGSLSSDLSIHLQNFYYSVIGEIYQIINNLYREDSVKFAKCLLPLIGFGNDDIVHLTCFHKEITKSKEKEKYLLHSVNIRKVSDYIVSDNIAVMDLKDNISSFNIAVGNITLQIRVKAMNKFTTPSLKVNCSIKENK